VKLPAWAGVLQVIARPTPPAFATLQGLLDIDQAHFLQGKQVVGDVLVVQGSSLSDLGPSVLALLSLNARHGLANPSSPAPLSKCLHPRSPL